MKPRQFCVIAQRVEQFRGDSATKGKFAKRWRTSKKVAPLSDDAPLVSGGIWTAKLCACDPSVFLAIVFRSINKTTLRWVARWPADTGKRTPNRNITGRKKWHLIQSANGDDQRVVATDLDFSFRADQNS
ncbi:MAG: hypothetical protein ACKVHE_05870 [Planctomycetales bacterium]|jgi:hypothetical protein